ncbi:pyridoxamine 5'-phosphate oxidase family protein [uncultured Corynebacterium sp.]|uniref:pyridoxamine 5'-phosphate oxidase family protein n=1 Tax=uncultured Corynebacterium sp. TaxID=159447 RepID=UPI0025E831F7|nr:pyridoxamine 5'-phosphate oxidase family protein [uncultured Corynebacterium sp.]
MATLTNPMKEMISQQLPFLATVTDAETLRPNLGPKRSLRVWDDHTLVYNENTGRQHYENLREGSLAAVAVVDWAELDGYRFIGPAKIHRTGPVWDACLAYAEAHGYAPPKAGVLIHVQQIYTLMIGSHAGELIDSDNPDYRIQ